MIFKRMDKENNYLKLERYPESFLFFKLELFKGYLLSYNEIK